MDDLTSIQTVKTLSFVQIPKHSSSVLSSRSTEGSIWGYTYGVNVSSVSNKIVTELAVGQRPYLNKTIPSSRYDEWNLDRWAETNTGNPSRVSSTLSTDGVLALSKSVPQLDSLITGSRNNLTVVYGESNR